ncbi:MAG: tRNA 4-thiouridine(8) synthase ThiI [Oligoflexales bacterium]|nr:tRNA 4-thiouridine(8) synthase ThiI [Oligoflexales bacterium]
MLVLVRLSSEINLKSNKVKARFLRKLIRNIDIALKRSQVEFRIRREWNRLFIEVSSEEAVSVLSRIFGIGSISPVEYVGKPDLDDMSRIAFENYRDKVKGKSFCIRAQRNMVEGFTSKDVENRLGDVLRDQAASVKLKNPEVKIELLISREGAFFFSERIKGPSGLPLGVEGRALCLISGGFDSAVAAWLMMKRGIDLDFLFCNLAGIAYERATLSVVKALMEQWAYGSEGILYTLDFSEIIKSITANVGARFPQIVLKRAMYRTANLLADEIGQIPAIITGESAGQVSSQTLYNLAAIDRASSRVVLRPLIGYNKDEIIRKSVEIGTYVFSEHIQEYCQISQENPKTKSTLNQAQKEEDKIDPKLYADAVAGRKKIMVNEIDSNELATEYLFTENIPDGAAVIDCRDKMQYDAWHFPGSVNIELESLLSSYKTMEKRKTYVLYCPFGLQTAVAAEKMQKSGYEAYSFKGGSKSLKAYSERF